MNDRALAATAAIAVVLGAFTAAESDAATIFVNHDEWTLRDVGFANAPAGAAAFVNNLVAEMGPKIHAYSDNPGFIEGSLAIAMANAGATYTTGTAFAFTLENITGFDALFLGGNYLNDGQLGVLSTYVAGGGNVYIAGGTGIGGAEAEATAWNSFLSPFEVQMGSPYNGVAGNRSVFGDSLFDGVSELFQNNGNPLSGSSVFCCGTAGNLFAVYRTDDNGGPGPNPIPLPAAGWIMLSGLMSFAAVRRRRRS
jgi:hypothetical protein